MKILLATGVVLAVLASALAGPLDHERSRKKTAPITQGGEDPDPEIRARRNFVKQVKLLISNNFQRIYRYNKNCNFE
jgi:hypothetical protein